MAGSFVYLLSIAEFLRQSGYRVAFIGVSPDGIGIRPYVTIDCEVLKAFDIYRIRGWHGIGEHWLRSDSPVAWISGPMKLLLRKGLPIVRRLLSATIEARLRGYSRRVRNLSPASAAEVVLAQRYLQLLLPRLIFINYFHLTNILELPEAIGCRSFVLTHQLFSERTRLDYQKGILSEWKPVREDEEMGALAKASTIVAIQEAEARVIRRYLPASHVVTAPLATPIRQGTRPQLHNHCLFVGSASHHNALGLAWFLESVWPAIRRANGDATLRVYGEICRLVDLGAPGVKAIGQIPDLLEEYAEATICVVPLIVGAGLKIKLVEAFCHGRTGVATSIGVQGLEGDVSGLVAVADDPDSFARDVIDLMRNHERRKVMEARALAYAAEHYSQNACYSSLLIEPTLASASL
jgi:glycosyltransferase involved in cell wall biosynthesis